MKNNFWMPLYIGDYLRDTMHLSRADHGSYMLLIFAYWTNKGPLKDDDKILAGTAKCSIKAWKSEVRPTISLFFDLADGFWRHKRIDEELLRIQAVSDKQAAKANKRWQCRGNAVAVPQQSHSQSQSHSESEDTVQTNNSGPRFPSLPEVQTEADMRGFDKAEAERFWNHFESSGWIDKNGHPIKNWRPKLAIWCSDAKSRSAEKAHHGQRQTAPDGGAPTPTQMILYSKELERVEARILSIRGNYSGMQSWTDGDKAESKRLKSRRDELKKLLGVSV